MWGRHRAQPPHGFGFALWCPAAGGDSLCPWGFVLEGSWYRLEVSISMEMGFLAPGCGSPRGFGGGQAADPHSSAVGLPGTRGGKPLSAAAVQGLGGRCLSRDVFAAG